MESENPKKEPDSPGDLMRDVIANAKHLERRVAARAGKSGEPSSPGWSRLWLLLRRLTERFYRQLEGRVQEGAAEPADPEWQRRKQEIQARALRTDALLHDLELRQEQANREWQTAFGELERLREDWLNLRDQISFEAPSAPGIRLQEQLSRLELLWAEIMQEDSTALREREAFSSTWRRLVGGLLPRLEKTVSLPESQAGQSWLTLARRLRDLDRRWRGSSGNLRREVAQEENQELSERLSHEEGRSRQMSLRLLEALRRQQELESMFGAEESDAQRRLLAQAQTIENSERECRRLAAELQESIGLRDKAFRRGNLYKGALQRRRQAWRRVRDDAAKYLETIETKSFELKSTQNELASMRGTAKDVEFLQQQLERKLGELETALQAQRTLKEQRDQAAREIAAVRMEKKKLVIEVQAVHAVEQTLRRERDRLTLERDAARRGLERADEGLKSSKITELSLLQERERLVRELETSHIELQTVHGLLSGVRQEMEHLKMELQKMGAAAAARAFQEASAAKAAGSVSPAPSQPAEAQPAWNSIMETILKPLTAANANLRRLALGALPEGQRAVVSMAYSSVGQAQDFVKMVDTFLAEPGAPAASGTLQPLVSGIVQSWEPAFRQRSGSIVVKFDPGIGPVRFHAEPMRIAVYQVIRNAYEAMARGGCLTIRLWQEKDSKEICLSFSDTGPGFSQAVLKNLFAPALKSKPGHLGMGLAVARKVLSRVGGRIAAQNAESGRGAVVTMRFPIQ